MKLRGLVLVVLLALAVVPTAFGSVLLARNATNVQIRVVRDNHVLKSVISFKANGEKRTILAWGALNARAHPKCGKLFGPRCGPAQVEMSHMRLSPTGHYAKHINGLANLCHGYDGPSLKYWVTGCKGPDGTYWGLQSWIRLGPVCTRADKGTPELRLSHWSGAFPKLQIWLDWTTPHPHVTDPIHYTHLFGQYTYKGAPVYGLNWTPAGVPTDGYGRVIYIESRNTLCHGKAKSRTGIVGGVWDNDESGLSKPIHGEFCHDYSPPGTKHFLSTGDMYRATAMGPGVTPDVSWGPVPALDVFDPLYEAQMNALQRKLSKGSKYCTHIH
jgi:hypothetical protein